MWHLRPTIYTEVTRESNGSDGVLIQTELIKSEWDEYNSFIYFSVLFNLCSTYYEPLEKTHKCETIIGSTSKISTNLYIFGQIRESTSCIKRDYEYINSVSQDCVIRIFKYTWFSL